MSLELRDYQNQALEAVINSHANKCNRQMLTLPTGAGKTVLMAAILKHFKKKTLIIAHREELIFQTRDKIMAFWPEASVGICKADLNEIDKQIVIGSVQTCSKPKRLAQLKEAGFEVLMIDETHHAGALTYRLIIDGLRFSTEKNKLLVGVTATPNRSDNHPLVGTIFDEEVFKLSIGTLIRAGHLSPVLGRKILTNTPIKKIKTHMGDFAPGELAHAINNRARNIFVVEKYKQYATGRKAVAFCVNVKHAQDLAQEFTNQGLKAAAIWGAMGNEDRKKVLTDFKDDRLDVVTSVGVLTEGFDEPSISCIIMARPTKSCSLYKQMVGRGLRTFLGKSDCLVLDFTDRYHSLNDSRAVISVKNAFPEAKMLSQEQPVKKSKDIERPIAKAPVVEHMSEECDKEYDLLNQSKYFWIAIGDDEYSLSSDDFREIVVSPSGSSYIAHIYDIDGSSKQLVQRPISLKYCLAICEDYASECWRMRFATMQEDWIYLPATPGQIEYLKKQKAYKRNMNKAAACIKIREIAALRNKRCRNWAFGPLTPAQKFTLEQNGIDIRDMTKLLASRAIADLKQDAAGQLGK